MPGYWRGEEFEEAWYEKVIHPMRVSLFEDNRLRVIRGDIERVEATLLRIDGALQRMEKEAEELRPEFTMGEILNSDLTRWEGVTRKRRLRIPRLRR